MMLVPFQEGTLIGMAYRNGSVAATDTVQTAGSPAKIVLKPDRNSYYANDEDLIFIETNLVDSKNVLVPNTNLPITYSISGPGKIVAVDNGNAMSYESFRGNNRNLFNGKSLVIVRPTCGEGTIVVTAKTNSTTISSASVSIKTTSIKAKPVIGQNKDTLSAFPVGYSYQWYLNDQPIPGATQQTYIKSIQGAYKVEVTDGNGCLVKSDSQVPTGSDSYNSVSVLNIYPNPSHEKIFIETDNTNVDFIIRLLSVQGALLKEIKSRSSLSELDIQTLSNGIYILEVDTSNGSIYKKIIKE